MKPSLLLKNISEFNVPNESYTVSYVLSPFCTKSMKRCRLVMLWLNLPKRRRKELGQTMGQGGGLLAEAVLHEVHEKVQAHHASVKSSREDEKVEGPSNRTGGGVLTEAWCEPVCV